MNLKERFGMVSHPLDGRAGREMGGRGGIQREGWVEDLSESKQQ